MPAMNGFSQTARTNRDGLHVLYLQQAYRSVTVITQAYHVYLLNLNSFA
jgi:hypothetical protein